MAVTSQRSIATVFTVDVVANNTTSAANNASSPGQIELKALSTGDNTITKPTGATACTIIMPANNTVLVTLKGINGDTGIPLHKTDPTSIGLDSTSSTFVLNAASSVSVRLIWT
jgi:hypothetical protein